MRAKDRAKVRAALPNLSLGEIEPYFVLFTLLSGAAATLGVLVDNVPLLVVICWFLFLAREAGSRARAPLWSYFPAYISGFTGVALIVLPFGPPGWREGAFALLSAGLPRFLLPGDSMKRWPTAWFLRLTG